MIKKKRNFAVAMLITCLVAGSTVVSAAGHPFNFTLTGTGKQQTASYRKNDNEQNAYVTMHQTAGFAQGQDVFGFRVRRSGDVAVTPYRTCSYFNVTNVLPYNQGIVGNTYDYYFMRGQIDSSSATKVFNISGVWLP